MSETKQLIINGTFYNAIAKYSSLICNIIVTAILARLLSPEDFGVVAITTIVISLFDIFADIGLGPAVIQNKELKDNEYKDIFSFSCYLSVLLLIIYYLSINPLVSYYNNKALYPLFFVLSIQLLFNTITVLPKSLLLKEKKFKVVSIVYTVNAFMWGVIAVISALLGVGIYSLLIVPVGSSASSFVSFYIIKKNVISITLKPSFDILKKIISFSTYQFLFNLINFFSRNLDKLLIGKHLGMTMLGYYEKSYRLMTLPVQNLTNVLSPTIQPVLSEYETDKKYLASVYLKICRLFLSVGAVLSGLCFSSSTEIVFIIFGSQWFAAVPVFRILAISMMFQMADSLSGGFLQASDSAKYLFLSGLLCAVINVSAILVGIFAFHELNMLALLISTAFIINLLISSYYIYRVALESRYWNFLTILIEPLLVMLGNIFILGLVDFLNLSLTMSLLVKLLLATMNTVCWLQLSSYCPVSFKIILDRIKRK